MPQKMPQKILPTKQPGAKSGRIELRRYNWFRRCAMLQKRCAMLHTPAEFQLKWSQILLRPNHPNLHLLKHIFYLFLFIYFFVRLSELANTQLDVALSRSSFFWYIMQWHTALPMFALIMSTHLPTSPNMAHAASIELWPCHECGQGHVACKRRRWSEICFTSSCDISKHGRKIRKDMFDIVIIVIIVIIWYFFMVPPN